MNRDFLQKRIMHLKKDILKIIGDDEKKLERIYQLFLEINTLTNILFLTKEKDHSPKKKIEKNFKKN